MQISKFLLPLLFCVISVCFGETFLDPFSGVSFEVPQGFAFNEEESKIDPQNSNWWYAFSDSYENILTVEIEEYDHEKTLPEYFHYTLTEEEMLESVIYDGMEFKNVEIGGLSLTKCKLRILTLTGSCIEPLYFCDYLFVKDRFGFSINLMKKETSLDSNSENDAMMLTLIQSLRFTK